MDAEHSLDSSRIPHGDLRMGFLVESRVGKDGVALEKHATDGVDRGLPSGIPNLVKNLDHRAVELPQKEILAVSRQWNLRPRRRAGKFRVGGFYLLDPRCSREVKAKPQLDHRSNNGGTTDAGISAAPGFPGEFETASGVGFPEVNPGPQPVIVVATLPETAGLEEILCDVVIAAVVTEDERRRQLVHYA